MLGEKIKVRRNKLGLSQEFVAEKLNISRQAVSKWEAGKSSPNTSNLIELSNILKMDVSELIEEDAHSNNSNPPENLNLRSEKKPHKEKLGFLLHLFYIILGTLFFLAYTIVMTEIIGVDYKSLPWLFLSIYMIVAIFTFPEIYSRATSLDIEQMDYFLFSKVLLPLLYLISPIALVIALFQEQKNNQTFS